MSSDPILTSEPTREPTRVVLITGAGGALGSAYVRALARAGYGIVVNDTGVTLDGSPGQVVPGDTRTPADRAERVAAAARAAGAQAVATSANIAEPDGAQQAVDIALSRFGRLDAVVNNAGFLRDRTLLKLTVADIDAVLEVHLRGTMLVSRAALPALRRSGTGRLVHTASAAIFGSFGQTNYAAAKLGIIGFSRSLALEESRFGITSNVIAPFARSRMTDALLTAQSPALGPDLVAPMVEYLASADCEVTGETFTAGGGHIASVVLGLTPGWHGPADRPATQAELADNLAGIRSLAGMTTPAAAAQAVLPYLETPEAPVGT